jgi:hypothetical protein
MSGVQNYLNTIIFCVVSKTLAVLILGLLVFEKVRQYAILLLTIEIGLATIIIWSVWKISRYDKRIAQEAEDMKKSILTSVACPDYYTRSTNADMSGSICTNTYVTPDQKFTYKFLDSDKQQEIDSIDVDSLFHKKTVDDACSVLVSSESEDKYPIPWTDLRSKCSDMLMF